jgi:hypothetical protein
VLDVLGCDQPIAGIEIFRIEDLLDQGTHQILVVRL